MRKQLHICHELWIEAQLPYARLSYYTFVAKCWMV